jgi:[protein-PII] uridylyltransferase
MTLVGAQAEIALDAALVAALPRSERAAALRPFLDGKRRALEVAHQAGAPGDETCREWARAVDEVVRALLAPALAGSDPGRPVALAAVGGYGREELAPHSDLDLWFVVDRGRGDDPLLARLAEEVLYPLWDLRLDVGHAVRSVDEALALAASDLTAATALLDARHVAGEDAITRRLDEEGRARVGRDPPALAARLAAEKHDRHARFGDTVFLLEPDLKNGEGGYRDLNVSRWAANARFGVRDFPGLLALGQATARQVTALVEARRFYLTVRTAAHLFARRRQDRLLFEVQEAIAPALAPAAPDGESDEAKRALGVRPAVAPQVEWLMQRYYLHAQAVEREGGRLLDRAAERPPKRPRIHRLDASFVLWNGKVSTHGPEIFRDRPSEMVRTFSVALDVGAPIYGHTRDLIAEQCARPETAGALARDPEAGRQLLALLTDPRDAASPSLLEQMHDLGLLVALMPEFGPCAGRVQHDLYHVFTVDQHSLYAVARLKALARGDLADALPVATSAMREVAPADRPALYLGTLLHDVGKPLGKAHSVTGARLSVAIATRLGMSASDVARTELLVRQHLLLAHLSQRRDVSDNAMIAHLAGELGDEATLRQLYLLTLADMSMVSPENMTSWKERLLRELYARTLGHFRRGPDLAGTDHSQRVAQHRARAAQLVGEPNEGALAAWFDGLPDRYFAQSAPRRIARHVQLSRGRKGPVAVDVTHRRARGWSELTVVADDVPGLLAKIAGVLLAARVDILGAQIASRRREGTVAEAIDLFLVRDRHGGALTADGTLKRIATDLARVVSGEVPVETLVDPWIGERRRTSLPARVTPAVATEVEADNQISDDFTVLDVYTQDRPGVLYTITRTLAALGHDIHLSKVATEADRVADVFYIRTSDGGKLDDTQLQVLRDRLYEALNALPL